MYINKYDISLSIGDVSKMTGRSIDSIRKLDEEGVLPANRTSGNQRRWDYCEVDSFIKYGIIESRRPLFFRYHTMKKPEGYFKINGYTEDKNNNQHFCDLMNSNNIICNNMGITTNEYWSYEKCSNERREILINESVDKGWSYYREVTLLDESVPHNETGKFNGLYYVPYLHVNKAVRIYTSEKHNFFVINMIDIFKKDFFNQKNCPPLVKFEYYDFDENLKIPRPYYDYYEPKYNVN